MLITTPLIVVAVFRPKFSMVLFSQKYCFSLHIVLVKNTSLGGGFDKNLRNWREFAKTLFVVTFRLGMESFWQGKYSKTKMNWFKNKRHKVT